jgi:hypothetical protein
MDEDKLRYWQNIQITQFGFASNLIFGLATALIVYICEFVQNPDLHLNFIQKVLIWLAGFSSVLSVILGVFVVYNRLKDFRLTTDIVRNKSKKSKEMLVADRLKADNYGSYSWFGLKIQVLSFLVSFVSVLIIILINNIEVIT